VLCWLGLHWCCVLQLVRPPWHWNPSAVQTERWPRTGLARSAERETPATAGSERQHDAAMRALTSLIVAGCWIPAVFAQDMRGACVSCMDKRMLCDINCVHPEARDGKVMPWPIEEPKTEEETLECLETCRNSEANCQETSESIECFTCITECSEVFGSSMASCLQSITDLTAASSFDDRQDDCSIAASTVMDQCIESCYGDDIYDGWSQAAEEGVPEEELSDKVAYPKFN